jgi:transposase-like protein
LSARNERIIAMRREGIGPREIARQLGLSPNVVAGVINRAGLATNRGQARNSLGYSRAFWSVLLASTNSYPSAAAAARAWSVHPQSLYRRRRAQRPA